MRDETCDYNQSATRGRELLDKTYLNIRSRFVGHFHNEFHRRLESFIQQQFQDLHVHRGTEIIYVRNETVLTALKKKITTIRVSRK